MRFRNYPDRASCACRQVTSTAGASIASIKSVRRSRAITTRGYTSMGHLASGPKLRRRTRISSMGLPTWIRSRRISTSGSTFPTTQVSRSRRRTEHAIDHRRLSPRELRAPTVRLHAGIVAPRTRRRDLGGARVDGSLRSRGPRRSKLPLRPTLCRWTEGRRFRDSERRRAQ